MPVERRVVFVTPLVHQYRSKFHELIRVFLRDAGVRYDIVFGTPNETDRIKRDTIEPEWATKVKQCRFEIGNIALSYHPVLSKIRGADMVILMQENKHLQNYMLQALPRGLRPRLGMMGHGRNFQSRRPNSLGERWKKFWAMKVDWWFGYTDETRRLIESLGFPADQITVFNNSVDTSELRNQVGAVTTERLENLRAELGLVGRNVGVFVGGIYPDKRVPFLVTAADHIRGKIQDFEMIIIGGGSDLPLIRDLAATRPWIRVMGPRFGEEKVALMMLGQVFLMPGLMGLAILDAGAVGLPIATTAYPWHSPEIAYLSPGENGVMVQDWQDAAAYADAVVGILVDPERQQAMSIAARAMADRYSIEAMAANFAAGVLQALKA